jgi:HEAT repeat protein
LRTVRSAALAAAFFVLASPAFSRPLDISQVRRSASSVRARLGMLRVSPQDCANPPRWSSPHAIPSVDKILQEPVDASAVLSSWTVRALNAPSPSAAFSLGQQLLGGTVPPPQSSLSPGNLSVLPEDLKPSVERILRAIAEAQSGLDRARAGLSVREQSEVLRYHEFPFLPAEPSTETVHSPHFKKLVFRSLDRYDQAAMMGAAGRLLRTIDGEMPRIQRWAAKGPSETLRIETPLGAVWIGSPGDDHYDAAELSSGPVLLIEPGGRNRYGSGVAAAGPGQVRIVVDFGETVAIDAADGAPSAGSGAFGIGLLYLQNPGGWKEIRTGSFSQGSAICGVGGLFLNGPGRFEAQNNAQGMGFFGVGMLINRGASGSEYRANRYAQGIGFTRGVGIFRHEGSSSSFWAGMTDPDPREPLGRVSLCQGVGYGPRAYASGGVGLCVLRGNGLRLESSYFAQGAGYWHAAGGFLLEGSSCTVKARRYDQGSGIHAAAGGFFVSGDGNHIINWGAGPACAWDQSVAWTCIFGRANKVQSEWGAGMASLNGSRSFFAVDGTDSRLDLPGLGTAQMSRDIPDYAVALIQGSGHRLKRASFKSDREARGAALTTPWGAAVLDGVVLSSSVGLFPQDWTPLPQEKNRGPEAGEGAEELEKSQTLPLDARTGKLLEIASAFTTDRETPRKALAGLVFSEEALPLLVSRVDPADFDGFIQLRVVLGLFGPAVSGPVSDSIRSERDPERKAWLLSLLGFSTAERAAPVLLEALDDPDWRVQVSAGRVLAALFDRDRSANPGRLSLFEQAESWLTSPSAENEEEFVRRLCAVSYAESAAVLSSLKFSGTEGRLRLLEAAPADINGNFESEQARKLLPILSSDRNAVLEKVRVELASSRGVSEEFGKRMAKVLAEKKSARREVLHAALLGLGKVGRTEDAGRISDYLDHSSALVREEASAALGRLGRGALSQIRSKAASPSEPLRLQALLSACKTTDADPLEILEAALKSPSILEAQTAWAVLEQLQSQVSAPQKKMRDANLGEIRSPRLRGLELQKAWLYGD